MLSCYSLSIAQAPEVVFLERCCLADSIAQHCRGVPLWFFSRSSVTDLLRYSSSLSCVIIIFCIVVVVVKPGNNNNKEADVL